MGGRGRGRGRGKKPDSAPSVGGREKEQPIRPRIQPSSSQEQWRGQSGQQQGQSSQQTGHTRNVQPPQEQGPGDNRQTPETSRAQQQQRYQQQHSQGEQQQQQSPSQEFSQRGQQQQRPYDQGQHQQWGQQKQYDQGKQKYGQGHQHGQQQQQQQRQYDRGQQQQRGSYQQHGQSQQQYQWKQFDQGKQYSGQQEQEPRRLQQQKGPWNKQNRGPSQQYGQDQQQGQYQQQQRRNDQGQQHQRGSYEQHGQGQQQQKGPWNKQQSQDVQKLQRQEVDRPFSKDSSPSGSQTSSQRTSSEKGAGGDQTVQKFVPTPILTLAEQLKQTSLMPSRKITPGTIGTKIKIETNHLQLNLGKLEFAFHYDVKIEPDIPKKFLRQVMEEFRLKFYPERHPAFDGKKNLYCPGTYKLVEEGEELRGEVNIMDGDKTKSFKVVVKFAKTVDLSPLHYVNMTQLSPAEAIQCVEIVLRSAPSSRCIQAGRSFFTAPPQIINLGDGMEMYYGFYQSVVRGWKPLLNVDVAHKAFPKETDILSLIIELCSTRNQPIGIRDLEVRRLKQYEIETVSKFLRNLRVVYQIPGQPGSKREYGVNGLQDCPKDVKFRLDNGPETTVEDYFQRTKNYRLRYPLMPTLWVGNRNKPTPILLPAELCTILPGQTVQRKMTDTQTSNMISKAATSTIIRKQKIMTSMRNTEHNQDPTIKEFGFQIGSSFEQVQARILPAPMLEYANGSTVTPRAGVWRQDDRKFLQGAQINSWAIVSFAGQINNLMQLADMIFQCGPRYGMRLQSRAEIQREYKFPKYKDIEACFKNISARGFDLVFVIIPNAGVTYSDVKKAAELRIGCLTQCIKQKTMFKLNDSTIGNILLKVNSKLNGTNQRLFIKPWMLEEPCMIMGADVTHPSPESQHIPSVAAVTASYDPQALFRYNISCRLQPPKMEIISDLQEITEFHLRYFFNKNNGQVPRRIIFFRDGVSEGQFAEVRHRELTAIRKACTAIQAGYEPKITFLVVQKRHHTRFFPMDPKDSDDARKNFNVKAGTCVDTDITNPNMQDFYLVSHASIQGVAKPTKYCTLWDDSDFSNDDIEQLAYHLCHLFTRCNRSVSYPAPTYYAHLAAARAKVYIEQDKLDLGRLGVEQRRINILDTIRIDRPMFFV